MDRSERRRVALAAGALVVCVVLVFGRIVANEFVAYDTASYITHNPLVRDGWSWPAVQRAFTSFQAANWHPLTWCAHMLDVELFGFDPRGHHAVNLALHALNSVLVLLALRSLTGRFAASLCVALLFALHPLRVESVAWIVERKDLLAAAFGLGCWLAYAAWAHRGGAARYALVVLTLALGLLSKPMLVTWPFVLLLFDVWPLQRTRLGWRRLVVEKLPLVALALGASVLTFAAQRAGAALAPAAALPFDVRLENAATAYGTYIAQSVAPFGFAVYYPHAFGSEGVARVLLSVVTLACATRVAWILRARTEAAWIGWLYFLGTLVPVIGLVQVGGQAHADRYTYLPALGLTWAIVFTLDTLLGPRARYAAAWVLGFALVLLAALTFRQAGFWRNSVVLAEHALAVSERNAVAHNLLGFRLSELGEHARALEHLQRAAELDPSAETLANLGLALLRAGELDRAEQRLREALQQNSDNVRALESLGTLLVQRGRRDEALVCLRRALALDPAAALARNNLGEVLEQQGDPSAARDAYERAARDRPELVRARVNLGRVLIDSGELARARDELDAALTLDPASPQAHQQRARAHVLLGDDGLAIADLRAALAARAGWALAQLDLAWLLARARDPALRDPVEAVALARAAVASLGARFEALDVLGVALACTGHFEDAIANTERARALALQAGNVQQAERIERRLAAYRQGRTGLEVPR